MFITLTFTMDNWAWCRLGTLEQWASKSNHWWTLDVRTVRDSTERLGTFLYWTINDWATLRFTKF